jgi:hypothetical protein
MSQIIESLSRDSGILLGALLGTIAMLSAASIGITAIGGHYWRLVRQTEDNNALKHTLLSQGMTADEIATVIKAWPSRHHSFRSPGSSWRERRASERVAT